ncbi:hypothetical protein I6F35_10725 [Bradyrhizobium sp. BRP22]|uniref:hypothetical protein n=1 Tax=Bradyrhizobium sp. BRP22 TaxID=2793821 RepID=UPI001CD1EF53|nr:hypothetical protein [Bradyrhizobium sp. BRP22]MCA1453684.1 hypothetical protein [Bradyrhizobium sp. BRP22]
MTNPDKSISTKNLSQVMSDQSRGEFFAGLFAIGCISGLASRVFQSANKLGWMEALSETFEVSVVVWVSCAAGVYLVLQDRTTGIRSFEVAIGAAFAFLILLPIGALSWLAVAALGLYVIIFSEDPSARRGAFILVATTVPVIWSRLLFQFFADLILRIDASLVGWLLRTPRTGDIVGFADGSGVLVILPGCSSLANMSLAFLCWITLSRLVDHKRSAYDPFWCLLACVSVIAVNVTRMSVMGLSQWHYDTFHSPLAAAVANAAMLGLILGCCLIGVRREFFQRI